MMDRQIHRLQKLINEKQRTISDLSLKNKQLERQLSNVNKQNNALKQRVNNSFSYETVPDRQIIQTLEAKLATAAWQIIQLQKMNTKYQQDIIKLQKQIMINEQQIGIQQHELDQAMLKQPTSYVDQASVNAIFKQWEETIKQKQQIVAENLQLKQKLKNIQSEMSQKMQFYLNEVQNLSIKIKNQHEGQNKKLSDFESLFKQLRKQNQQLRQAISKKNQQLYLFYNQTKQIPLQKSSDMHTIRNLRLQLRSKTHKMLQVLSRLKKTQQLQQSLQSHQLQYSQSLSQLSNLSTTNQELRVRVGLLEEQLAQRGQEVELARKQIEDTNRKLYEILIENQACHELLYEAKGYSKLFIRDVESKVESFIRSLDKRRENGQGWTDVSELVEVNYRLKNRIQQ